MGKNPLEAFGSWLAEAADDWPEAALHSAHREFIDIVAVMVAGAGEPASRRVFAVVEGWGDGPSTVVGRRHPLAPPWAALVNGTAGHVLDYDDNFDPPKAHATTVLAPAILALGEELGASGRACLDAYIRGLQIMGRIGQGLNPPHRNRGWHATATMGAMGATAACARLLGLDAGRAATALSIATSMAAGFMSQFGTMTKPLHAGLAAKAGILAARLAEAGLSAGLGTLEGPTGMTRLMVGPDFERLREALTQPEHGQTMRFETEHVGRPLLILEHGFRVKRFANCGSTHRALDGLLALKAAHGFGAKEVERVEVFAPAVHLNNLMYHDPQDGLEAKFSMEYALAVAVLENDCPLSAFTDESVRRPEVRALFDRIVLHPVDQPEGVFPTRVVVHLKDGQTVETTIAMPLGSKAAPFPDSQYWAKFDQCVDRPLPPDHAKALRQALEAFPDLPSVALMTRHLAWDLPDTA